MRYGVVTGRRLGRWFGWLIPVGGGQGGQSATEFALVVPVFLLLLIGAVEICFAVVSYNRVSHAAHEAARYGMMLTRVPGAFTVAGNSDGSYPSPSACTGPATSIVGAVACQSEPLDRARITVVLDTPTGTAGAGVIPGLPVRVEVRYAYEPLTPLFPFVSGLIVAATAESRTQ